MCLVMLVVMVESTGMFLAVGEMTDRKVEQRDLTRGLLTDGLGTLIGGIFNTFPYTSFSQNVGLVAISAIKSRWVTAAGGIILLVLGLIPKLGALVTAVPLFVLGGAGIVMFGMVAATGIRILASIDYKTNRNNVFIVAISIGFGMIPLVAPAFFAALPKGLAPNVEFRDCTRRSSSSSVESLLQRDTTCGRLRRWPLSAARHAKLDGWQIKQSNPMVDLYNLAREFPKKPGRRARNPLNKDVYLCASGAWYLTLAQIESNVG